jgi:Ni,Fe-hydrogenase III small subunit
LEEELTAYNTIEKVAALECSVPGCRPMSKVIINALVYPVEHREAFYVSVVEEHAATKSC